MPTPPEAVGPAERVDMPDGSREGLKREIGVFGLSANIVNIIVGAGIFALPALVAARLGAASVAAYAVCGLAIAAIMLCFAEVGSRFEVSGGAYMYIERAFGPFAGFLALNVLIFGASVTADAAVANALVGSLAVGLSQMADVWVRLPFVTALFAVLAWLNVRGVKLGAGIVAACTIGKLAPLVLLAVVGWVGARPGNLTFDVPTASELGAASLLLFFAFQGAEVGLNVGGEVRQPGRTVPLALLVGLSIVVGLYVLVQLVCQAVLGSGLATYTDAPLAETARIAFGPAGGTLLLIGASISMFGYLSGALLNMPRVLFRGARDRVIPWPALASVHARHATPYVAILAYVALDVVLTITRSFEQLVVLSNASILLVYLGVVLAVPRLRRTIDGRPAGFRVPGGLAIPIVASVAILWLLGQLERAEALGMAAFLLVLTAAYPALRRLGGTPASPSGTD